MNSSNNYKISTISSHSALQILKGAKDEGFETILIVKSDRKKFYKQFPFIDEFIVIKNFSDFPKIENELKQKKAIIIPHGSFVAYLGEDVNKKMKVRYFGNKSVLDWEADRKKQRLWLEKAKINVPHRFKKGDKIDRPVIVKSYGAAGGTGYFLAKNQKDFDHKLSLFTEKRFVVQEYVIGVAIYIHYFYSPLTKRVEIMSIDRRYETNVDSLGRLPLHYQSDIKIDPSFVVVGNQPLTLRESLLPEAYVMGERIVAASKKLISKRGLYGPFCLETIVTPDQKFYIIEISCRIVAGTNLFIQNSPYTSFLYNEPMSTGRRIAREIKNAIEKKKIKQILS